MYIASAIAQGDPSPFGDSVFKRRAADKLAENGEQQARFRRDDNELRIRTIAAR
jgi:hypothetical protein